MKIREIILELGPEGLAAERQRAQAEIRLLQQIDFNFAAQFEKSFRKYGRKSVDTAYQAAISDGQKSGTIGSAEAEQLKQIAGNKGLSASQRTKQFVSALPQAYKNSLPNVQFGEPDRIGATGKRWGNQYYSGGGVDKPGTLVDPDAKGGFRKGLDKAIQTTKDVFTGARTSTGLKMGGQLAKAASGNMSAPVKTNRRSRSI